MRFKNYISEQIQKKGPKCQVNLLSKDTNPMPNTQTMVIMLSKVKRLKVRFVFEGTISVANNLVKALKKAQERKFYDLEKSIFEEDYKTI